MISKRQTNSLGPDSKKLRPLSNSNPYVGFPMVPTLKWYLRDLVAKWPKISKNRVKMACYFGSKFRYHHRIPHEKLAPAKSVENYPLVHWRVMARRLEVEICGFMFDRLQLNLEMS